MWVRCLSSTELLVYTPPGLNTQSNHWYWRSKIWVNIGICACVLVCVCVCVLVTSRKWKGLYWPSPLSRIVSSDWAVLPIDPPVKSSLCVWMHSIHSRNYICVCVCASFLLRRVTGQIWVMTEHRSEPIFQHKRKKSINCTTVYEWLGESMLARVGQTWILLWF